MLLYVFDKILELFTFAIVWNIESLLVVFSHSLVDSIELDGKKENKFPVGPALLGFFLFIVVGSAVFQILNMATSQGGNTVY